MSYEIDGREVKIDREKFKTAQDERDSHKDLVEKDFIPNFFPTYQIASKYYPVPIIIAVICSGILAYATYVLAGVNYIEGGYISEAEYGAMAGLLNGLIFTIYAAISAFVMIYLMKKKGIEVLKYIFGGSFAFIGFFLTLFFGEIFLYLAFYQLPATELIIAIYYGIYWVMFVGIGIFTFILIYKYFTTESTSTKNFIVLYIGIMIGAMMGVMMPLVTTLAILIGISFWDIYAVKSKKGPIKEMIDLMSPDNDDDELSEAETQEKIKSGELSYDTSKLEIGIGDLAFYSMLSSGALIFTGNIVIMILTSIAIIMGTGITISGLKRNKILPGLPISIFLGIGTMLISWGIAGLFI